ncbi:histidine phosphatase family protein [Anaerocaecibacter muris]|uniref:histidine phosphatase family protein n=1 Tax=Anaerocaecibacter muris TaxID=2941513 RepID=UPI00308439D1
MLNLKIYRRLINYAKEFDERVRNGLYEVVADAENNGYTNIAIVTHGNVTRSIYKNILNVSGKVDLDLLAITELDYHDGIFLIERNSGITIKK